MLGGVPVPEQNGSPWFMLSLKWGLSSVKISLIALKNHDICILRKFLAVAVLACAPAAAESPTSGA